MTAGQVEADTGVRWAPLLGGIVALYAVLQGTAGALNSVRGEAGLIVAAATLAAALLIQRVFFAFVLGGELALARPGSAADARHDRSRRAVRFDGGRHPGLSPP
jgi:hypothetical protein